MSYQEQSHGQPQQPVMFMQNSPEQMRGQQLAQTSFILGIISLFFAGLILGPIAIMKAKQAEKLNVAATAGKVLGWISTILGIFAIVIGTIMIVAAASMS